MIQAQESIGLNRFLPECVVNKARRMSEVSAVLVGARPVMSPLLFQFDT